MSELEETLAFHLKAAKLPVPEREYRFDPERKWRFDFAWVDQMLAVECEGGQWVNGRHNHPQHTAAELNKYNAAAVAGWKVLRFNGSMIESGQAVTTIEEVLR
jgi:very-short-patch-repair endonuclease